MKSDASSRQLKGRAPVKESSDAPVPAFISNQVEDARRFYLTLKPSSDVQLEVLCGGWERCAEDYRIERNDFPYFSLEFVAEGSGFACLNGEEYALAPGSVFTYGPGVSHWIKTDPSNRLVKYFVDFTGSRVETLLSDCRLELGACTAVSDGSSFRMTFDQLIRNGGSSRPQTPRVCALLLEVLLLGAGDLGASPVESGRLAFSTFERCRAEMATHFRERMNLKEMAQLCGIDSAYLCRLFRRFDGSTPYQFLQRLRMNWAAEQLHGSGQRVRDVAEALRLDPFQFSRTFKRIHGVPPSAFQRRRG